MDYEKIEIRDLLRLIETRRLKDWIKYKDSGLDNWNLEFLI